ncbi:MAG: hypothetical protein IT210_12100 [Armatimonadetes bacterium]|nr:hypothetical protein [Armatimonadota bacterium]
MITISDHRILAETKSLSAIIENGFLVSLKSKQGGEEYIQAFRPEGSALQLFYPGHGAVDVAGPLAATVSAHRLSSTSAQLRLSGWDADGVMAVSEDEATGDLLIEPSAYSSRAGALSCRWLLPGVRPDLDLAAPFFQGVKAPLSDPMLERRWIWPQSWEAGMAILQGQKGGFWVHCRDDRYRYKALNISGGVMGFETESYGPIDNSLGAGGLTWRVNVFRGGWEVPAGIYRDWLWLTYALEAQERNRKPWMRDIRFALSWFHGDPAILDAIAARVVPRRVLLHFSDWRVDPYDENYPTFTPSENARAVFAKAKAMGFHLMPHCNSVDMDPTHAAYAYLRDFQYRDVQSKRLLGWGWDPETNHVLGVPNSNHNLSQNRYRKVMIKVHPGLSMWRSILAENIRAAVDTLDIDTVFIDVTLCSHNLHNCLVENMTPSEGMKKLILQIASLNDGLAVGGEGLNEITMQGLSFAQAHLFESWHNNSSGLARTGGCALNDFLFGRLCRTFGYSGLSGKTEAEALRMRIHEEHGAIPTVVVRGADEILNPNPAVQRAIDLANG